MELDGYILCSNWIATRYSVDEIVRILALNNVETLSFEEGLHRTHTNNRDENPNSILISPKINGFHLIMGHPLMLIENATVLTEKLSANKGAVFAFGVDIWCAYHSWLYAENGQLIRYYENVDSLVSEYGEKQEFEQWIEDYSDGESVFLLSKKFGLDMDELKEKHLAELAWVGEFINTSLP